MNSTAIKSIAELVKDDHHFLVEDYQRGYKWTTTEVEQLLEDIHGFDGNGFYCLQPIVVKRVVESGTEKIELIDGQQRITTIFIVLSFLNQEKFSIEYRTRESSARFLEPIEKIEVEEFDQLPEEILKPFISKRWNAYLDNNKENDNIDNYHFFTAYLTIKNWFKNNDEKTFAEKLLNQVKVIWYEVPMAGDAKASKKESIRIFTRINSGKIPLTNAELIKALFLINVEGGKNAELLQLKQNEIAQQWDSMEYALQDDAFWYFLSNDEPPATRIELIFDLIKKKDFKTEDKLYTFLQYNTDYANSKDKTSWVETEWSKVKRTFMTLQEWYEDRRLYHLIGFLIWKGQGKANSTLINIINWKNKESITRKDFENKVKEACKIKFNDTESLETLVYKDPRIKQILLLFNIETLLQSESSNNFSFSTFKKEKWDIEHIHAQQSLTLNRENEQKEWLEESQKELEKIGTSESALELAGEINSILEGNRLTGDGFRNIQQKVLDFYSESEVHEDIDSLPNLALLDAGTNRSYKNAVFSVKRSKIISQDQRGVFIPICTKNVFLKYYSKDLTQLSFWRKKDRDDYLDSMKLKLKDYIKTSSN